MKSMWRRLAGRVSLCFVLAVATLPYGVRTGDAVPTDVPSGLTSTVSCHCVPDARTGLGASGDLPYGCTLCPGGGGPAEDVHVEVVVRNALGMRLASSTVTVTAIPLNGAGALWCTSGGPTQVALTGADGLASFVFDRGSVVPVDGSSPSLDFYVTAEGPGPGGPVLLNGCEPTLRVHSYDLDQESSPLEVTALDFAIFVADFFSGNRRSDFNHDGWVSGPDSMLFVYHYIHSCDVSCTSVPDIASSDDSSSPPGSGILGDGGIWYELTGECHVSLEVYDVLGHRLATLVDEDQPAGRRVVYWDGTNREGSLVASGVYFYRLVRDGQSETRPMVLVR